jgi:hypothetical protein
MPCVGREGIRLALYALRVKVALTTHAVERYHERVKPALSREAAKQEAKALIASCEITEEIPAWCVEGAGDHKVVAYAVVCDGVAFPLAENDGRYVALTCLARMSFSGDAQEAQLPQPRGSLQAPHPPPEVARQQGRLSAVAARAATRDLVRESTRIASAAARESMHKPGYGKDAKAKARREALKR